MHVRVTLCLWLFAIASLAPCARQGAAQAPGPRAPLVPPPMFTLDQWTTEHGLPQNSVTAIAQAPDGYLWIGTFGGLARFDGTSFTLVERIDSAGRHVDRILSLAVAPDSALWIGTEDGLLRRKGDRAALYTTADGLPDNEVSDVHVDHNGEVWIGTARGIVRYAGGRFTEVLVDGRPLDHVTSISEDADGTMWVDFSDRFVTIAHGAATGGGAGTMLLQDRAGARWFSRSSGLTRAANGAIRLFGPALGVPRPSGMVEDPRGGYWLTTNNDGLYFFDPARPGAAARHYPLPDGRARYRVRAARVDRDGNVWFGTNASGLVRAKRNLFTTYTNAHGLSHDVATALYEDATGTMWAATNCFGVNAIDRARRTLRVVKPRRPGDPHGDPCVFALTESPRGTMWIGTWGGGLTRRTADGREQRLKYTAGLRDSVVLALFTDRDGTVWVGTNTGGVAALDVTTGRVRVSYTTADGLAHNSVRTIYQTRDGALWIGTLGGLSRFVDGRFTTYGAAHGLSTPHVRAIHEDADGNLWIGTYGGGLHRMRDDRLTRITRADGLADDVVSAILEDERGNFWTSGNRGIARVARRDLIGFAEGRLPRVHAVLYGARDGLLNPETNGGFQPAAWKDARGLLWFPTVQGVAVIDPARVRVIERAPSVSVEEVIVDGVARDAAGALSLGPGRPNLEFRYAGLSLSAPEHITFRYRLEGFEEEWVNAAGRRVAYYPRVPPGRYRFVVTAANRDGAWSAAGATLALQVAAPFWTAWWFRAAALAAVLGVGAAIVRQRETALRRRRAAQDEFSRRLLESQEHERRRLAGELHDGLGQDLLVVKNRALIALGAKAVESPVRQQLELISQVATLALENVRSLAHHLSPYQLDHLGLSSSLRAMIDAVDGTAGMTLDSTIDDIDGHLPVEGQINLYRIVQEAVTNIVKHSAATTALVRVRRVPNAIAVTIADDGRGFAERRNGFGLSSIAERARILGARLELASAPGRGTRIELWVPVANGS